MVRFRPTVFGPRSQPCRCKYDRCLRTESITAKIIRRSPSSESRCLDHHRFGDLQRVRDDEELKEAQAGQSRRGGQHASRAVFRLLSLLSSTADHLATGCKLSSSWHYFPTHLRAVYFWVEHAYSMQITHQGSGRLHAKSTKSVGYSAWKQGIAP